MYFPTLQLSRVLKKKFIPKWLFANKNVNTKEGYSLKFQLPKTFPTLWNPRLKFEIRWPPSWRNVSSLVMSAWRQCAQPEFGGWEDSWIRLNHSTCLSELHKEAFRPEKKKDTFWNKKTESFEWFNPPAKLRLSVWTSCTCHQAVRSPPRWRPSDLAFQASSDEDLIGLKSSLEAEILLSNLPLYDPFGEEKKTCHFEMNCTFKKKVCWSEECYIIYGIAGGFLKLPRLSLGYSASSHACSWWTNSKFNFVQNMFTPVIYLYMYNAVDHNKSFLSQQSLIISTLLSSFTLQTQQLLLKISQGTNIALLRRQNNYLINHNY